MRTLAATISLLACAAAALLAQQPPVFRSGTELVALDVAVVDADGRPVRGLTPDDFQVTVDGTPRAVVSAQFLSQVPGDDGPGGGLAALYTSNQWSAQGRTIILVVDQGSLRVGGQRAVLTAASGFLDRLAPSDRVGLVTLPGGGPIVEVTTDRRAIREALARVTGQAHPAPTTFGIGLSEALYYADRDRRWDFVVQRECNERYGNDAYMRVHCRSMVEQDADSIVTTARQASTNTVASLQRLLLRLSSVDGPKTIVFLSEGLVTGSGGKPNSLVDTSVLRTPAAMAGASVYVLHMQGRMVEMGKSRLGPTSQEDEALQRLGLDTLAARTRGAVFPVTSAGDAAFERVARETSAYYLLGIAPGTADRDGRPHALKVQLHRGGATVRARADLLVTPARTASSTTDDDLLALLKTPGSKGLLPVTVGTYAYEDAAGTTRLLIAASFDLGVKAPAPYGIGYLVLDGSGGVVASAVDEPVLGVVGSGPYARHQYTTAPQLAPGEYVLRLAAIDGRGRRGMVEHRVTLPGSGTDATRPGELLLFDGGRAPDAALTPLPDGLVVGGELGLHAKLARTPLATGTRVHLAVASASGATLAEADGVVTAEAGSGRALVDGTVAITGLPPAEYVARAVITQPDGGVVTLARPFRRVLP